MASNPFFTIITASLNRGSTIQRTLESIRNQTFKDLEHIVVDGWSTDNTLEIIKAFEGTYPVSCISEPDSGIAEALNKGLNLSAGTYVLIIQADDCLPDPHTLEKVYTLLMDEAVDIYSFPIIMNHLEKGKIKLSPVKLKGWNRFKLIFLHQGTFVHKRIYEKVGNFNTGYAIAMDYDFFYRALLEKPVIKFGAFPIAEMSGAGIGTSNNYLTKRLREEARVQKQNEKNIFWKLLQTLFRLFYIPYKTKLLPLLNGGRIKQ